MRDVSSSDYHKRMDFALVVLLFCIVVAVVVFDICRTKTFSDFALWRLPCCALITLSTLVPYASRCN